MAFKQIEERLVRLLKALPSPLSKEGASKDLFILGKDKLLAPMTVFLLHEVQRFNKLLEVIKNTCEKLLRVVHGSEALSQEIEDLYASLDYNKVPKLWADAAYPSSKPLGSWLSDLRDRIEFLSLWLSKGKPSSYSLSSFYFPQGFLTSVL